MNSQPTPPRVLVIDDEPFQLELLARQWRSLGVADVQTCSKGRGALELIGADPTRFNLICCDLQMPDMDGVEFLRHLGSSAYAGKLVLISGEDLRILNTAERLAGSHKLGVLGSLPKPVTREQLQAILAALVDALASIARPAVKTVSVSSYGPAEIERAIVEGELVNFYQPQVEFMTGRLVGVEALVRWQHPRDGLVYPDQFIGIAEDSGLMNRLTQVVIAGPRGALRQARAWQDAGLTLQMSVNVSMETLTDCNFPDHLEREAAAAGVAPSILMLEVTESRMMKDSLVALDILTRLRLKRVGVSIDDFGTGHSTFTQLHEAPFSELKIDRSFVHGAWRDPALRAIVLPTLDIARRLRIPTVAEGVEDADDWHFFRLAGCEIAQGYFVGRPMPAAAIGAWASTWNERRGELLDDSVALMRMPQANQDGLARVQA